MASSKHKGDDKKYRELLKGTYKLHKEIDELETAYLLHRNIVDADKKSVHGLIRQEIGGSRWAHGGAGKLTTYKSSKDLIDKDNNESYQQTDRQNHSNTSNNRNGFPYDSTNSVRNTDSEVKSNDKILDLKTKVLKKASSKIIRRDSWAAPETVKVVNGNSVNDVNKADNKSGEKKAQAVSRKPQKLSENKHDGSIKRVNGDASSSPTYVANKAQQKQVKPLNQPLKKTESKENISSQREQSVRRSRREIFNENKNTDKQNGDNLKNTVIKVKEIRDSNANKDLIQEQPLDKTYTPRKSQRSSSPPKTQRIFTTQPPEPTEIHIDPKTGQVKITSAKDNLTNGDSTRVYLKPVSVHNSVESNKMTCSIVDNDGSWSNRKNDVPDIFGLEEFKPHSDDSVTFYKSLSSSPLTTAKQCNTEVEFWLHSLNIPDIDKYVRIFADNDVDLTDLEFMSASQLHDMGVTAFGALDKILKGIRDLKNQSVSLIEKPKDTKTKHLTSSSIAWEEIDDNKRDKRASITNKSCQSQTFVKQSFDTFTYDTRDRQFERSPSVLSNVSEINLDSGRLSSARSTTPNPSFAASTHSSNAKCVDKKRPPSAKTSGVKPAINNLPSGKNTNQSQNKTGPQSVRLKRSNSSASEKSQSRMKNIDNKPNKGVLLRPRSSSLTREASRLKNDPDKPVKTNNEKKETRQLRTRSRSADVVKRKALEGVQAAAKKFEERNQKCKDGNKIFPPADERKKLKRNEMAARHIQREKYKEINITNEVSSDTDKDDGDQTFVDDDDDDNDQNLQSLVTVNIMSPQKKTDPASANQTDKSITHVVRPQVRRSSRTNRSKTSLSSVKPLNLQMDNNDPPLLASYKIRSKDCDSRSQSEHESGYKTDNSTTYTQVEDRVRDIQLKIKRLKDKATCGDDMTLNLVHNLQKQLAHFEKQLKDKDSGNSSQRSEAGSRSHRSETESGTQQSETGAKSHRSETESRSRRSETGSKSHRSETESNRQNGSSTKDSRLSEGTPRSTVSTYRQSTNGSTPSTYDTDHSTTETSTVNTVIQKLPVAMETFVDNNDDGVRMSKQELLDEMRKEKQQHHLQIIQLQSELLRFKQSGPVSSLELDPKDISYKIEDMIGEGMFSRVYKGEYQGSEVAVKQLKLPLQQQDKNYFAAEVSLLKELRHPRVVLLIGVCTTSKLPVMILEYMSSGSLYDYLHNQQCESLDHALYYQIARDISSGMNYLHSHKPPVLHLDLKSMNVLLCQSLRAKIADFGFSKLRLENGSRSGYKSKMKKSRPTNIPAWMSPELLDKGEINGKTDVYSFGIILWEMLTRNFPYKGLSVFQVIETVRKKNRPKIPEGTPEGLTHLINLCWDQNPAKRPQFKDVLQILENLSFPPAWRELFQKAGVPDTALQDVQSTRTIISLVTGTLDSGKSGILHSFMVAHSNKGSNSGRNSQQSLRSSRSNGKHDSKKEDKLVSKLKDKMKKLSTRSSNVTSEWDCDIVSSLSDETDESDMTLKNLRSSSDESKVEYESDESSILSSDDQNDLPKYKENEVKVKKSINAVVPNLELSIQSARDELKAERRRITGEPDWLSISLDDRSQRSDFDKNMETSHRPEDSELRLTLNSSLSKRTPTPTSFQGDETTVNESARSRRRNKSKDITRYSEDFWRRESYHNLRPPSPKKKTPLGKKLLESPCRTPDVSSRLSMGEISHKHDKVSQNLKTDSFVEKSYDSFFGHSSQELSTKSSVCHSDRHVQSSRQTDENDVDFESHLIKALKTEPSKNTSSSVPLGRKSISNRDEICVEDMENEVVNEMLENASGNKNTSVVKDTIGTNSDKTESKLVKVSTEGVNNALERVMKKIDEEANKVELNIKKVSEDVEKTLENKLNHGKRKEQFSYYGEDNSSNRLNIAEDTVKASENIEKDNQGISNRNNEKINKTEAKIDRCTVKSIPSESSKSAEKISTVDLNTDLSSKDQQVKHFKEKEPVNLELNVKDKESTENISLKRKNEIRVVLNEMLTSKDFVAKSITNSKQIDNHSKTSVTEQPVNHSRKSVSDSVTSSTASNDEGIRVKLNLEEVPQKKKPAITPRRSIKAKSSSSFSGGSDDLTNVCLSKSTDLALSKVEDIVRVSGENIASDIKNTEKSSDKNEVCDKSASEKSSTEVSVVHEIDNQEGKRHSHGHSKPRMEDEYISSTKKKTIRVKVKKDPLVPNLRREMSSPIPPAPPPPPPPAPIQPIVSKSVQDTLPRSSLAEEIKLRVANRQSVSEAMFRGHKHNNTKHGTGTPGKNMMVPRPVDNGPKLMNISELDETLVPQQSEGLPFMVQSLELKDQKDHLRSISKRHPNQLDDLSNASQEQLSSIADILKKAVMNRRLAMGEDGDSVSQSMESAATGWSIDA